jgi:hypothetical protein
MNASDTLNIAELIELLATFPTQSPLCLDVGEGPPNLVPVDVRRLDTIRGIVVLGR